ncbi:hypothetical protein QBC44DRAFT_161051 [Cladorrhinum sp. PSN332]|nr:hypothetical protein QBC44DRAFT_161051 [Cladorrhinum sp. PSN332]
MGLAFQILADRFLLETRECSAGQGSKFPSVHHRPSGRWDFANARGPVDRQRKIGEWWVRRKQPKLWDHQKKNLKNALDFFFFFKKKYVPFFLIPYHCTEYLHGTVRSSGWRAGGYVGTCGKTIEVQERNTSCVCRFWRVWGNRMSWARIAAHWITSSPNRIQGKLRPGPGREGCRCTFLPIGPLTVCVASVFLSAGLSLMECATATDPCCRRQTRRKKTRNVKMLTPTLICRCETRKKQRRAEREHGEVEEGPAYDGSVVLQRWVTDSQTGRLQQKRRFSVGTWV